MFFDQKSQDEDYNKGGLAFRRVRQRRHRSRAQAGGLLDGGEAFLPFRPGLQIHRLPKRQGRRGARGDRAVLCAGGGDPPAGRRESVQ